MPIYIDGCEISSISDVEFEPDFTEVKDYVRDNIIMISADAPSEITFSVKIDSFMILKLTGIWDFVLDQCPNKRVVHFANHGRRKTRRKNFKRACRVWSKEAR